jgi:hypothetical protein
MRWLPWGIMLVTGCASALANKQAEFSFNSSPQQAQVFVDDSAIGETPLKTKLSTTKAHTVTFKKEGFQEISCQLEQSTTQTGAHECTETLRPLEVGRADERSNRLRAELLQDKEFGIAFDDVRRLGVALEFQEVQVGLLRVTIGPGFATVSSANYNLEHLYSVYRTTSYRRVDALIELWKDGVQVGEVTSRGVLVGPRFSGSH